MSLIRSAPDLWIILLLDVTLKIRDVTSEFHFALTIPEWTDSVILSDTFGPCLCRYLERLFGYGSSSVAFPSLVQLPASASFTGALGCGDPAPQAVDRHSPWWEKLNIYIDVILICLIKRHFVCFQF